jgi:hypothetical protein
MNQVNPYDSPEFDKEPAKKPTAAWKLALLRGIAVAVVALILMQVAHVVRRIVSPAQAETVIQTGVGMVFLFLFGLGYAALALLWGAIDWLVQQTRRR